MNLSTLLASFRRRALLLPPVPPPVPAPEGDELEGVWHGDSLEVLRNLPPATFDSCLTDPPYRLAKKRGLSWKFSSHVTLDAESAGAEWDLFTPAEYMDFTRAWLKEVCRVVKPNGNIVIFGSFHGMYLVGAVVQQLGLRVQNHLVWNKPNAQPNITARMFCQSEEHAIWIVNAPDDGPNKAKNWTFNYAEMKAENGGKQMRTVWECPVTPSSEKAHGKHPTQKPRRLMGRLIRALTNEGDRILDPFCGSGTTLVEAYANKRLAMGIERELEYVELAAARLADVGDPAAVPVLEPVEPTLINLARRLWAAGRSLPETADPAVVAEYERIIEVAGPPIPPVMIIEPVAAA